MKTITADGEILDIEEQKTDPTEYDPFWKTPYNHNTNIESTRTGTACYDESKTQQSQAADAEINNILAKFLKTGEMMGNNTQPQYGDVEEAFDLQSGLGQAADVKDAWEALPAAVRSILKTPKAFVDYVDHCMSTGDLDPLRELGIADPLPPPETPKTDT